MYIPDRGLLKRMQAYDPKLNVRWCDSRERWEVTRLCPAPSQLYDVEKHICFVENNDGSYRPFDIRTFRMLKSCDHHVRRTNDIMREQMEVQRSAHRRNVLSQRAETDDLVRDPIHWAAKKDADTFPVDNRPKEDRNAALKANELNQPPIEQELAEIDSN